MQDSQDPDDCALREDTGGSYNTRVAGRRESQEPPPGEPPKHMDPAVLDRERPLATADDSEDLYDDDNNDDALDGADMRSGASATVRTSIWEHEYESGRRYHHYRRGRYPLPNDDVEQEREYMKHVIHMEVTNGKLFNAPIVGHPQKILDLCTGTGLWAIAVAKQYPSAEIVGIDLSPIQPFMVPPNVRFLIDDIEDEWMDRGDYDFIHMRHSCIYLRDVDKLVRNCYNHLKPGSWLEITDYCGYVRCDDGTMPEDYPVAKCAVITHQALRKYGMNTYVANEQEETFRRAGFRNIQCKVIKMPIGAWPKDSAQRLIGMYFRDSLQEFVGALGAKPLRTLGWSDAELEVFLATVRKSLLDKKVHSYLNFISWWGQK